MMLFEVIGTVRSVLLFIAFVWCVDHIIIRSHFVFSPFPEPL